MQNIARLIGIGYLALCLIALAGTALFGSVGYAPFPVSLGPAQQPVVISVWYGTEKEAWLEEAVQQFQATSPREGARPIEIELIGVGSREMALRTAQQEWGNDTPPTVLSPASSLWVEVLTTEWEARNGGTIVAEGANAPQPLVLTPLVMVAWEERAAALWDNGPDNFWQELHTVITDPSGWGTQGHPEWGFVKLGHTSPLTSNSGAQTLILMSYGYYNKVSGLTSADILDQEFQTWLTDIEQGVLEFGDSTGTFMTNMVQFGPSKYDFVVVYENLAVENIEAAQGRWGQDIRVYYPPATLFSDHPYAILEAPWTTPEQQAAAAQFRDFLLSSDMQELALLSGFRPADPSIPVVTDDPENPFNKYQNFGIQVDIAQQVETPPGDVINTLLELWRREIGG